MARLHITMTNETRYHFDEVEGVSTEGDAMIITCKGGHTFTIKDKSEIEKMEKED